MIFQDRTAAGRLLAAQMVRYKGRKDVIVLGIPRGGVVVASEAATAIQAPLDIFLSRKLGVPGQEELAFGAIASGGVRVLDHDLVEATGISEREVDRIAQQESGELERRERAYRGARAPLKLEGQTVILVDDGIATGSSMRAAIEALRRRKPTRIVVAVPVAPASTCNRLKEVTDELICLHTPESFFAIGQFYRDFSEVSDEEVTQLLQSASHRTLREGS